MNDIQQKKLHVTITERNIPIAKMIPIEEKPRPSFGWMKGTGQVVGDIIEPINKVWDAKKLRH